MDGTSSALRLRRVLPFAGSLQKEKSAHVLAGEEMGLFSICSQRTDWKVSNYSGLLMWSMHMH